jgi:RNA polymerase sigma-70 factor (ECF subfamily)
VRTELSFVPADRNDERTSEPAEFEVFFREQYPVVLRIARGIVGDAHLAEDVAQETLIAAQRRFAEPCSSSHAAAWTRVAATHLGLNALRSRRRSEERHRRQPPETLARGPEDLAIDREDEAELRQALGRLSPHSATVLVLRHSGLSYAEVADAMGVKASQVGTMLRRAESALRKEVQRATHS